MPAAVPAYVGQKFDEAPPGHKFRLYWSGWAEPTGGKDDVNGKEALWASCSIPPHVSKAMDAMRRRQRSLAERCPDSLRIQAETTGPLVTGTGIEHPVENGFAFLDPHGAPCLPGASVKGVLRRAGEELALFEADAALWTLADVWYLFGFDATSAYLRSEGPWRAAYLDRVQRATSEQFEWMEPLLGAKARKRLAEVGWISFLQELTSPGAQEIHYRGALVCWDAIIDCSELRTDIMNPHHQSYYQEGGSPSDDGNPIPIFFLAVPPGARIDFLFTHRPSVLRAPGASRWRDLVEVAWSHSAEWLGFGGKTSVGYGRLQRLGPTTEEARREDVSAFKESEERWEGCVLRWRPNDQTLTAEHEGRRAFVAHDEAKKVLSGCSDVHVERLKKKKFLANATVQVVVSGNLLKLVRIVEVKG